MRKKNPYGVYFLEAYIVNETEKNIKAQKEAQRRMKRPRRRR